MPDLNRRKFLVASAGVGAAGLLSGAVSCSWPDLMRAAQERPLAEGSGVLVIVTLYGGNDGINTVIPYADNAYHDLRPQLAFAPADVLHLDDQLGLNPALKGLEQVWKSRKLAIVRGVELSASPITVISGRWTSGRRRRRPNPCPTGWIGRWLDATGDRSAACRQHRLGAAAAGGRRKVARPQHYRPRRSWSRRRDSPKRWTRSGRRPR